jgi:hypothetical protein
MLLEYEWEIVEKVDTDIVAYCGRKICRTSIVDHLKNVFPDEYARRNNSIDSIILTSLPVEGITCQDLSQKIDKPYWLVLACLTRLVDDHIVKFTWINRKSKLYYKNSCLLLC